MSAVEIGWDANTICGADTPFGTGNLYCRPRLELASTWFTRLLKYFTYQISVHTQYTGSTNLVTFKSAHTKFIDLKNDLHRGWCYVCQDKGQGHKHCIGTHYLSCLMTKPTKWNVRPAKTQISLGIRPVWSESSLSAWRKLGSLATHWVHSEDSDQTGQMPRLIWVFAGHTAI